MDKERLAGAGSPAESISRSENSIGDLFPAYVQALERADPLQVFEIQKSILQKVTEIRVHGEKDPTAASGAYARLIARAEECEARGAIGIAEAVRNLITGVPPVDEEA